MLSFLPLVAAFTLAECRILHQSSGVLSPAQTLGGPVVDKLDDIEGPTARQLQDPCRSLAASNSSFYAVADARACLESVLFQEDIRTNVLGVVDKMINFDVFEYEHISQPSPLNQSTNLRNELARIKRASYSSDYDFNKDLYNVFHRLNDGHYYWSSCHSSAFVTFIPFPLTALASSLGQQGSKIYVAPDSAYIAAQYDQHFSGLVDFYEAQGINFTELAGAEVEAINGVDPWTFIDHITNTEGGTYPDQQVRRNAALASYTLVGDTWARNLGDIAQQRLPERESITYRIKGASGSKDVEIPYVSRATSLYTYTSSSTFNINNCLVSNSSSATGFDTSGNEMPIERYPLALFPPDSNRVENRQSTSSSCRAPSTPYLPLQLDPSVSSQYLGGRNVQFFVLPKTKSGDTVGVVFLASFDPDSECTQEFVEDTEYGFETFTREGVTKVIIDTTGNGGGSVALNIIWQSIFSGKNYEKYLNFESVFRAAPLAKKFVRAHISNIKLDDGYYGPSSFRKPDGSHLISVDNYFDLDQSVSINGQTLATSEFIRDDLPTGYLNTNTTPAYLPQDVIIYGDGTCGSACASFASFLALYMNTTTVVSTGRPTESIEYQSFEAGQAVSSDGIYSEMALTSLTDDTDAPAALLVQGTLGFALRGHVSPQDSSKFLQFISRPANYMFSLDKEAYYNPLQAHAYIADQYWSTSQTSSLQPSNSTTTTPGSNDQTSSSVSGAGLSEFPGWRMSLVGFIVAVTASFF